HFLDLEREPWMELMEFDKILFPELRFRQVPEASFFQTASSHHFADAIDFLQKPCRDLGSPTFGILHDCLLFVAIGSAFHGFLVATEIRQPVIHDHQSFGIFAAIIDVNQCSDYWNLSHVSILY